MSVQGDVSEFLARFQPENEADFVPMTVQQIALQLGVDKVKVNKTITNLVNSHKLELQRGPDKRSIVGYRILAPLVVSDEDRAERQAAPEVQAVEAQKRGRGRPRGSGVTVRKVDASALSAPRTVSVRTPLLDEYTRAKARFESLKSELGDYVQATFKENPLAEEALRLRQRLASIEGSFSDIKRERDEYDRDLRILRERVSAKVAAEVAASGANGVHSDGE